jgi:hypothetical protein
LRTRRTGCATSRRWRWYGPPLWRRGLAGGDWRRAGGSAADGRTRGLPPVVHHHGAESVLRLVHPLAVQQAARNGQGRAGHSVPGSRSVPR